MPKISRKPNTQLRNIVLEETNDGRDVVRYLKSVFMDVEDAPGLFGLSPKDYTRTHKIAAARILARLGLEEGKRYLRRNYVQTPFKRVHPEDEDGPKRDMAAATADLYRLVRNETNDGRDIMLYFVGIMKGYRDGYKPHLRMAAAKELVRQIEFDYDEPTSPTPTAPTQTTAPAPPEPTAETQPAAASPAHLVNPIHPVNPDSDKITDHQPNHINHSSDNIAADLPDQPNPINPTSDNIHPEPTQELAVADSEITAHPQNHTNHSSDNITANLPKFVPNPYREYAGQHCAPESESIYQSIIRRASDRPDEQSAKREAERLIDEFNQFVADRDTEFQPVTVPDELLDKSLTIQIRDPESYIFDPEEYYDFDRDDFFFCMCGHCEDCDELEYFFEFMRELEEDTALLHEDP